ncbi:hypothetical protein [Haloterrigena alkaliphila]|uniref:Glycyl aminopeptidase n=1 Tax=Haloterrigena alkaliphila TaxID=2816475 RepID=A0A8A2VRJ9_9EURY|nr:hypothetical protein [Haloterrigena alkaliphila]QSX00689.1 hypothetical protein J0X25_06950 [Haloterrigena alkaliphila]
MTSRFAVLLTVCLLIGTVPAGVVGAGSGGAGVPVTTDREVAVSAPSPSISTDARGGSTTMADADDVMHRTTELRHLPDRPGEFEAEMTFEIPEPMSALEIELDSEADVRSTMGFEATEKGTYKWTEETDAPSIRFRMPADRRGDGARDGEESPAAGTMTDAAAGGGGYTFVDTGEWGIVQVPDVGITFRRDSSVEIGIERTVTVDGPGAAGTSIAVFGPVTEYERAVDGGTVTLAVPDAADLRERPADILESIADADERLDVGSREKEMLFVAAPTDVDWGPRGIQYGESDAWVAADAPLDEASNVWLHEYVHVRQGFADRDVASDARWLVEGGAEYYAALLAYEQGRISFTEFRDELERGERSPYADGALADRTTWSDPDTDYVKGPLVYGDLDRRLRAATDGDRRMDDVLRQLNAQNSRVTAADFLAALEEMGGTGVRDAAETYTRTTATPDAWSQLEHRAAFDQPRAAIEYGLGPAPLEVAGQEWERWDRDDLAGPAADVGRGDVLAVPVGQRVAVPVAMANDDDRAGTADASLQVDGDIVDADRRVLEAGATATTVLSWTPTDPGVYDVRVGTDRLTVFVRSTPSLTVTDLQAAPDSVAPGDPVTVTATVATADPFPAAGALRIRTAEETTIAEPIALAPGETGSVEATISFAGDGRHEIGVSDRSTTVRVGGIGSNLESMPGFGVAAGAVAIGLVVAIAAVGRRRRR